jgi:hypothetical protein
MTTCMNVHTYSFVLRVRHAQSLRRMARYRTARSASIHSKAWPLRQRLATALCCKAKVGICRAG